MAFMHIFATWFEFWERNVFAVVCFLQGKEKGFVTPAFLCFLSRISTYYEQRLLFLPCYVTKLGFSWKTAKALTRECCCGRMYGREMVHFILKSKLTPIEMVLNVFLHRSVRGLPTPGGDWKRKTRWLGSQKTNSTTRTLMSLTMTTKTEMMTKVKRNNHYLIFGQITSLVWIDWIGLDWIGLDWICWRSYMLQLHIRNSRPTCGPILLLTS